MPQLRSLIAKRPLQIILFIMGIGCISLLAIHPFTLNQMPETADGLLHLFRVGAVDYSLKVDNPLWMRYSTGIVYGYGAPLFNYFPPLSYYVGSWLHTLGLSFVQSWLMMMVVYTVTSAVGMFLLGRLWTQSNVGGWISAIAYIYAPYFLFDSVARGTSSELGALAILPFALYGFTRLAFYGRRSDFLVAVISFAFFIPMHTIITLHGTALLGLYCLFLWITSDDKLRTFFRLLFAGGLALMMTAFFWMPAIMETDAVKIDLIRENLDQIDVTRHLRPLGDLFALPHTADPTQMAQPIPITLSVVQLILSAFGLIIAWKDRNPLFRRLLLFLWGILIILIFMNVPQSAWLWENAPLIGYTQFPWRILGLASLILALMTGMSIWLSWAIIPSGWIKSSVFGVLTLLVITYSIPWTYSLYLDNLVLEDIRDVHDFERETGQLTVSSYSEYLPVTTDERQLDPTKLIERFEKDDVIPRVLESDTLIIKAAEWGPTSAFLTLNSLEAQTLIFDWLYVEGWTAQIDERVLDVYPSIPVGLVAMDVPEGEFELQISLQPTAIQSTSVMISLMSIVGVIGVLLLWRFFKGFSNLYDLELDPEVGIFFIVVVIGIGTFLFKAMILDHNDTQFKTQRFGDLASENAQITPIANFGHQIDLIDFQIPQDEITSRLVDMTLYWKLHDVPIDTNYSSIVRMRDPQGIVIAESGSFQPGGLDTSHWLEDAYIVDTIELEIPQFTPPLTFEYHYTFDVSVFDAQTQEQLSVMNAEGNPEDVKFVLGDFEYWSLDSKVRRERIQEIAMRKNESGIVGLYTPTGFPELPDTISVGEEFEFNWTWQRENLRALDLNADYLARLVWIEPTGDMQFHSKNVPLIVGYPTKNWSRKEVLTGYHRMLVPAEIPAGEYQMGIQLLDVNGESFGDLMMLDHQMTITEPDRSFDEPNYAYESDIEWDNGLTLLGYDFDESGEIRLVWQTNQLQNHSLRLFVHILNQGDLIIAQSDGIPVDWTRPITSWIPEEYVTTTHSFDLPDGDYRIRLGWYDPVSGDRIRVENADAVVLDDLLKIE